MMRLPTSLVALAAMMVLSVSAAPRRPVADSEVLERLSQRAGDAVSRELAGLRKAMEAAPADPQTAERLAQRYFDLAIARGDPRYVGYAEAVVARFSDPLPASLRLIRGLVRQYRHEFSGAVEDFDAVLLAAPDMAAAQAWRGAVFLVQANYAKAKAACLTLDAMQRPVLAGSCHGLLLAYGGQLEAGYARLQQALAVAGDSYNRLWLLTHLGEIAVWRGQSSLAEAHFRAALALGRDDTYLLSAWSDFLLDAGRADEVVKLLAGWEASDSLVLRLTEAQQRLKSPEAARLTQLIGERFTAAKARGDTTHRAEEARFELGVRGNIATALQLAVDNYQVQREPRDARILLEAALAARDAAAAAPALDWLRRSGFEDQRLRRLAEQLGQLPAPSLNKGAAKP